MKRVLNILLVLGLFFATAVKVQALNFEQAFRQVNKKPMVALIYAPWANDYQNSLKHFRAAKTKMGNTFNFVELDIASKDAKVYSEKFHIMPKLPYIIMYRDGGRISRYIQRDCSYSSACITSKLKTFIQ